MAASLKSLFSFHSVHTRNLIHQARRYYGPSIKCKKLVIREFGDPVKVVKLEEEDVKYPSSDEVLVEMLVASINPADINTIQGVYPIKPELPGVPGFEGVAQVVATGSNVKSLGSGDWVIPNKEAPGTWRSHAIFKETDLLKIPNDAPLIEVAGMTSNTSTAYRMLKDFVQLKEGDVIIQNGANGAAGQNVIQFCKAWGIESVNIVRDRPNIAELKEFLTNLGATYVLTEQELRSTTMFKSGTVKPPCLGLNSVGGKSASELMRKLAHKGVMVTYGGMSREPVIIPTSLLIFKDVQAKGFWMTRWTKENHKSEGRKQMIDEIISLMKAGKIKAPAHILIPLVKYAEALASTSAPKGFIGKKFLIDFRI